MKINQGSKDIVVDSYAPYNRDADPHLKNYLNRKKKDNLSKKDFYANVSK